MPIRKLPPLLVNQIAAGEVIERPASVVKELVENSLDAGARRIDVAVEDGGRQLIRVSDDGQGIPEPELPLAVAPHATSKLSEAGQLAAIATLGFRGEALASIASVSRLRITSRPNTLDQNVDAGAMLEVEGDRTGEVQPAAASPGTVIEVRDLFFNIPARRKFLRAAATEFAHISETLGRIALARPEVAFTLRHNDRLVLDLPAPVDHKGRCLDVLGRELDEALLEFEHTEQAFGDASQTLLWGLAGLPDLARATAKFQYLYLNGRAIRDRQLAHAIREAYRGLTPPDKFPVAVVMIEMDPAAVDVNVHPAKAEVRFRDGGRVHGLVLSALRQRLLGADLTPRITAATGFRFEDAADAQQERPHVVTTPGGFVDFFKRMDPTQQGFVYQQVREAMAEENPSLMDGLDARPHGNGSSSSSQAVRSLSILQVHKSYVVTEDEQGLVIVDQHALHERVMFEELRRRIGERDLESQRLLMPAIVPVSAARMELLETLRPLLERIGMECEPIGPASVAIHAFATFLFDRKVDPAEFLTDLLDRAEEGELQLTGRADADAAAHESALHEVLDMMACRAAVRAGDAMSHEELHALLEQRDHVERSSNCPHGRPTTIRLTLKDLERQFGRS